MSARALGSRVADLAGRQAAAAERHAATPAEDREHAKRVAFLMMVSEDLRMAVGIALSDPDGDPTDLAALVAGRRDGTVRVGGER